MFPASFLTFSGIQTRISSSGSTVSLTDFQDKIHIKRQQEYDSYRGSRCEVGLSFWGDITVRLNGSACFSLEKFLETIYMSARATLALSRDISFRGYKVKEYMLTSPDIDRRVDMLRAAEASLTEACQQYRQGMRYTHFAGQRLQLCLEEQWRTAFTQMENTRAIVQAMPDIEERLHQVQQTASRVHQVLDGIQERYQTGQFSLADQQQLKKCSSVADKILFNSRNEQFYLTSMFGKANCETLTQESEYLCKRPGWVENIRTSYIAVQQFWAAVGVSPADHFTPSRDIWEGFHARLLDCINDEGFLDIASIKSVMGELASFILDQHSYRQQMQHRLQVYKEKVKFTPIACYNAIASYNEKISELNNCIFNFEMLFVSGESHKLFTSAAVPCVKRNVFGPSIPNTLKSDADTNTEIFYFGLFCTATTYLQKLRNEQGILIRLKRLAAESVMQQAKDFLESGPHVPVKLINDHISRRLNEIGRFSPNTANLILRMGDNSIRVHKAVLTRFSNESRTYFDAILSGAWKESNRDFIDLPDHFLWAAVVELICWLYGSSSIDEVPQFLRQRFGEVADYLIGGSEFQNKLDPPRT